MNETMLVARVQELLDARLDPFDDAEVIAGLDANPEWLPRLAGLRADAMVLGAALVTRSPDARSPVSGSPVSGSPSTGSPITGRRHWPWWVVVAGGAAAAALFAAHLATPPPRSAGRIVASSLTELRPRAHIAATFVVNDAIVAMPTRRWQTWQLRSEHR